MVGSPRLVRNLSITGRRKVPKKEVYIQVKPELIDFDLALDKLQISHDQFIIMGILVGTDYSEGVKGVGPKTAIKIVKEHNTMENVLKNVEWPSEGPSAEDIFDFFKKPPVTEEYDMELKEPDGEALKKMMVDEHNFSEERVKKVLERLQSAHAKGHQSSLSGFLGK
jgi:flap endonuclease-1